MISLQLIRKILLTLLPFIVVYFFKSQIKKKKDKIPFIVDKNNVEEGEIVEEKN